MRQLAWHMNGKMHRHAGQYHCTVHGHLPMTFLNVARQAGPIMTSADDEPQSAFQSTIAGSQVTRCLKSRKQKTSTAPFIPAYCLAYARLGVT